MSCAVLARTTASTTRATPRISLARSLFPHRSHSALFVSPLVLYLLDRSYNQSQISITRRQAAKLHCLRQFRAPRSSPSSRGFPRLLSLPKPVSQVERALGSSEITISGQGTRLFRALATHCWPVCIATPDRPCWGLSLSPANPMVTVW
jgi:hypothetical protein